MREIKNTGMHECEIVTLSASMTTKKKGNKRPLVMSDEVDGVDGVVFMIEIVTLSATVIVEKKVKGNKRTPVRSDEDDIDKVVFMIEEDGSNHHTQVKDGALKRRVNKKEGKLKDLCVDIFRLFKKGHLPNARALPRATEVP